MPTSVTHQGHTPGTRLPNQIDPVEAVRCALEVQQAALGSGDPGLLLRIGINLGDIIVEPDGDIYGEGVNVAARLEQLAEPGGLCISFGPRSNRREAAR